MSDYLRDDIGTLVRVLEKDVSFLKDTLNKLQTTGTEDKGARDVQLALLHSRVEQLEKDLTRLKTLHKDLDDHYVPLTRYLPVERIVFGLVGLILVAFVVGLTTIAFPAVTTP